MLWGVALRSLPLESRSWRTLRKLTFPTTTFAISQAELGKDCCTLCPEVCVGWGGGVEELAGENELFEIRGLEKVELGVICMGRGSIRAHHGPKSVRRWRPGEEMRYAWRVVADPLDPVPTRGARGCHFMWSSSLISTTISAV